MCRGGKGRTLEVTDEDTGAAALLLEVLLEATAVRVRLVVHLAVGDRGGDVRLAVDAVARDGHGDTDTVGDVLDAAGLLLALDAVREERVARRVAHAHDALLGHARERQELDVVLGEDGVEHGLARRVEVLGADDVDLVDDDEGRLVGEQGLDRLVELALQRGGGGKSQLALERERDEAEGGEGEGDR